MSAKVAAIGAFLGAILYILLISHSRASTGAVGGAETILGEKVGAGDSVDSESLLPPGLSSKEACFMLKQKYKIESGQTKNESTKTAFVRISKNVDGLKAGTWDPTDVKDKSAL